MRARPTKSRLALIYCALLAASLAASRTSHAEPEFIDVPTPGAAWAREISADGSTIVGESAGEAFRFSRASGYEPILLNLGNPGDPDSGSSEPSQTALAVNADGSVVVGALTGPQGRLQPYRWSNNGGSPTLDLLLNSSDLPMTADTGVAHNVSADGTIVVGSYAQSLPDDPDIVIFCGVLCVQERNEFQHAFRWQTNNNQTQFVDLSEQLIDAEAENAAIAISLMNDAERILITSRTPPLPCFGSPDQNCLRSGESLTPTLLEADGVDLLAGHLEPTDLVTALSADGLTVVGGGNFTPPFRWRSDTYFQELGRTFNDISQNTETLAGNEARDVSANGQLIVGDFGVWFQGRSARLKNLLINGLGLEVLGWNFERFGPLVAHPAFPSSEPVAAIGPGLHATSDDGTVWTGLGVSPAGEPRAIIVQTGGMVTTELFDELPTFQRAALTNATLPHARMARVGDTVSVFATMINTSQSTLAGCGVALKGQLPLTFDFVKTDPTTNAAIGTQNEYFSLPPGESQSLALAFRPSGAFVNQRLDLLFDCGNSDNGLFGFDVAEVRLGASNEPVVDVVALSATATADGIVMLNDNRHGAFVIATMNLGEATGTVNITPNSVPGIEQVVVCETDSTSGVCLAPAQRQLFDVAYAPGQERTFAVFMAADRPLRHSSFERRMNVNFRTPNGDFVGSTSVAVQEPASGLFLN